jgi:hypothetical protein
MRRIFASFQRVRAPRRFGAVLALAALLVQLVLPSAAALAMGADPLSGAPICRTLHDDAAGHGDHPDNPHKTTHVCCPLCRAQAAAWGFLPPPMPTALAGPDRQSSVVWQAEAVVAVPHAVAGSWARGPPTTA